jgi:hypothetical protein
VLKSLVTSRKISNLSKGLMKKIMFLAIFILACASGKKQAPYKQAHEQLSDTIERISVLMPLLAPKDLPFYGDNLLFQAAAGALEEAELQVKKLSVSDGEGLFHDLHNAISLLGVTCKKVEISFPASGSPMEEDFNVFVKSFEACKDTLDVLAPLLVNLEKEAIASGLPAGTIPQLQPPAITPASKKLSESFSYAMLGGEEEAALRKLMQESAPKAKLIEACELTQKEIEAAPIEDSRAIREVRNLREEMIDFKCASLSR